MPLLTTITSRVSASQRVRVGWWALAFCAAAASASAAQQTREAGPPAPPVRLLSATDGRKIAAAALEQDESLRGAQDCSHLVQQIYSHAGYEYSYVSSFDLYAGNGSFRRVRHPQPGDLITWPGHVGIVVDPARHSFYSLVRSGLQTEDYLGPYWRSRGRPRFYRYILGTGAEIRTAKVTQPTPSAGGANALDKSSKPTAEEQARAERASSNQKVSEASLRSKVIAPAPAPANESATESVPSNILLTSQQRRPTPEEALDGISELSNASAAVLRTAEPLNVRIPLVIFDDVHVERIEVKRDKGWAHLQINSHVRIARDGTDFKRRREKVRWELRRDASGWTAIAPAEPTYMSRDAAVRTLAARLAEMTQSEAAAQHQENIIGQEARIANLLSALLQD
jgi:NlpC/P60 family